MALGISGWTGLFTAGATLANSLLAQDQVDRDNDFTAQQNELNREQNLQLEQMGNASQLAAANIAAGASKYGAEASKDIALAGIEAERGKQGGNLLISDLQSIRNRPERFQNAITTLTGALKR